MFKAILLTTAIFALSSAIASADELVAIVPQASESLGWDAAPAASPVKPDRAPASYLGPSVMPVDSAAPMAAAPSSEGVCVPPPLAYPPPACEWVYQYDDKGCVIRWDLQCAAPQIKLVGPAAGAVEGGTEVTISGANLSQIDEVFFGGVPALSIVVLDPDSLSVITPPHAAGTVNVVVRSTTLGGPAGAMVDAFTYGSEE